ncbi:hypothetical protein QSH46_021415 [Xanthomonas arboricola pv. juglandis]|uniref:Uncharacterized protein n=1 Tax=Xanthomonas campestris pv. juglandis TaxID=195709 RepID=A0A7U7DEH8_XANCJ|nr:hypothetical protein [Xanthomonas arboricola]MDN0222616.1 hypothetical protein [Xanthomonas arboricola pv. juglandis]MDN0226879.1 hypothetical protein [Xanthomonas arboricola pv. juglandis]MDN0231124.1 hypothetical protein [Xanthomonas arboricola pv. juglandis]MDN0235368.1 hypothetical protein [Xanthomonas arboricola pv. juglandis]MDN0239616.1 hypothetical protein [Xanthomonas arboricola pv. juglandis]
MAETVAVSDNEDVSVMAAKLCNSLREFAEELGARHPSGTQSFYAGFNYNGSVIQPVDLKISATALAERYESYNWAACNHEHAAEWFNDLAAKVDLAKTVLPNLFSSAHVAEGIQALLTTIKIHVDSLVELSVVDEMLKLPQKIQRDASRAADRLSNASGKIEGIEAVLAKIASAKELAENLGTTQEDLEAALKEVESAKTSSLRHEQAAKAAAEHADAASVELKEHLAEAEKTMARVAAAYRASTSEGLAKAFSRKAENLNKSIYLWIFALLVGLVGAICIGATRFPSILAASVNQSGQSINISAVLVQVILAALSLGAPVWLAWVATTQIGQRFRLAEDYAYKAALAAAYEGYRSEAARLDPLMEGQLFSIALTRLDELPLRLVDNHVAGSPLHELIKSVEFSAAMDAVPGLRRRLDAIFRREAKTSGGTSVDSAASSLPE